ncbi:OmpA family protein [Parvularcula dongshanensis]|uniref:Outer membrane protein OmpA-like peptidoglycan-associated protein n=1 Tax=Parvularcula dongshanensis TaxID=1173995 RepID=A0A840I0G2_9PROT|nr:OmpA family protein [Parvularcula dongshanensis]MBB4657668.1 outer membrane protein OmpA-like peptidoglycan-associated protein [Parvularcula dongshanensis]
MKLKLALMAATGAVALSGVAFAQENTGWYGEIGAGVALGNDDNDFESVGDVRPVPFETDYDLDDSLTVYGALGKYFAGGVRGEIELASRNQDIDELRGDGLGFGGFPNRGDTLGDITVTTLMANVYKDFNVDAAGRVTPYIGAGIGAVRVRPEFNNIGGNTADDNVANGNRVLVSDQEYVLGYQGMAGLSFDFTDNMVIDLRYRYLGTNEFEYGAYINDEPGMVESEYRVSEITAGLRWNFGTQAEPAPAVEPTPPAPEYKTCFDGSRVLVTEPCPIPEEETVEVPTELELTVYFDYDRADLTDAAQSLIAARAAEAREYDIQSIVVQGNTDSSGSAAYNNRLSQRRANVVRDALVSNGIDASVISIEALGESNPARPTADGVREPLNRRTEVEFSF